MNPNEDKWKEIQIYTSQWNCNTPKQGEDQPKEKKLSKVTIRLIVDLKIATIEARTHWNIILNIQKEITINLKL